MKLNDVPDIVPKVKELKEKTGYSVKILSEKTDISESTINRFLSGKVDSPHFNNVAAMVDEMGGSLDDLIGNPHKVNIPQTVDRRQEMELIKACDMRIAEMSAAHEKIEAAYKDKEENLKKDISTLKSDRKKLFVILIVLIAFFLLLFTADFLQAEIGWIQYAIR